MTWNRRWVRRFILGAACVLVAGELSARAVFAVREPPPLRWHDYSAQLKVEQMETLGAARTVVIGTSMAQQDLVPEILAAEEIPSVYNAGLNGGVPIVMEPWLVDQVLPRLHPQTVVWGLSPLDLSASYGEATSSAYDSAPATKSGTLATVDRMASRISMLVAGRAVLRDPSALVGGERSLQMKQWTDARTEVGPQGERLAFSESLGPARRQEIVGRLTPFLLDRDDLASIARAVEAMRSVGIEVYFVELPTPDRFKELYPSGPAQDETVWEAVRVLADLLDVPLIRVDETFTDDEFVDYTHLDAEAAARFSRAVAAQLK